MEVEEWKRAAAEVAANLVTSGMVVGLGSTTTVAETIRIIAELKPDAIFVPSSYSTQRLANGLGLKLSSLDHHWELDLMIDGADEIDMDFNMIKGRGGSHTREKIIAGAAKRVVIVADRTKLVRKLGERVPVPVEIIPFAHEFTIRQLSKLGEANLRRTQAGTPFVTDDGNYIVDVKFQSIQNPARLELRINRILGVVENGIFVGVADEVLVGHEGGCTRLRSKGDFLRFCRERGVLGYGDMA